MLPESPLIVCCLTDSFRGVFKRGKDTEPKTTIARKKYGILLQRRDCARCILKHEGLLAAFVFPGYLFLPKYSTAVLCLLQAVTQPAVSFLLRRVLYHLCKCTSLPTSVTHFRARVTAVYSRFRFISIDGPDKSGMTTAGTRFPATYVW